MSDPLLEPASVSPADEFADSDPAEELLAECLALPEAERARAIEEACTSRPHLASDLRTRVAALRALGIDFSANRGFPEQLGDFRLIKVLGGGGMGVVYLAVQTSLQRDVALKLIRPEHLYFTGARARFRREAESVARLQHPGIVPIYAVGEDQGIPYFAMELIRGCTLAEALRALRDRAPESLSGRDLHALVAAAAQSQEPAPVGQEGSTFGGSWVEACIRITRQVAEALQHAHERGLVHRDVKPSNIALTPDGRAMLLDFGLTSVNDGGDMTRTGSALGTLHYMSPEQIRGARTVDARSDVYSLGVTLYEALALQLPYRGDDTLAVQRLVLDGRPDPIHPRNRRVDADVETVVLAAIDVDPARRYASCADFARDLGHLLAHRPIEARRPGMSLRARRWLQRHPALGTAVVLGPTLVLGAAIMFIAREKQHSHELALQLADTQLARDAAQHASARATSEAESAKHAFDFVVGFFTPKSRASGTVEFRSVPDLFAHGEGKVESDLAGDPRAQARMYTVLGRVFAGQGTHQKALDLFEKALAIWRGQDVHEVATYMAETLTLMGETLSILGRVPEACACFREALPLWPDGAEWAVSREQTFGDLSRLDRSLGSNDPIEMFARKALDKELAQPAPDPRAVGQCRADLGLALLRKKNYDEAADQLQAAFDALITPESPPERDTIVLMNNLAFARSRQGRLEESAQISSRAMEMALPIYGARSELVGIMLLNRAWLDEARRKFDEALRDYREAAAIFDVAVTPDHPEAIAAEIGFAELTSRLQRCEEAEDSACRLLSERAPRDGSRRDWSGTGQAYVALARCAESRAENASAERFWRMAICNLHNIPDFASDEALALADLARLRTRDGALVEAQSLDASALDLTHTPRDGVLVPILDGLVRVSRALGREAEAASYAGRLDELRPPEPQTTTTREQSSAAHQIEPPTSTSEGNH